MTATYDAAAGADKDKVRLLIPDTDIDDAVFDDDEVALFLKLESDSIRRAAAMALETAASNEALTLKVMKSLDRTTDGAKTSDALLARAKRLRDLADEEDINTDGGLEVIEWIVDPFQARERRHNDRLRELG